MLVLGFAAGLPLLLIYGTLSYRLREAGVSLATVGFFSWVALVYSGKWLWAPLADRLAVPVLTRRLGRRRAWLIVAQAAVIAGLLLMAVVDPQRNLAALAACALFTAFAGATQDICLDAYRIESAPLLRQAAMAAAYQTGYRLGMIWAGAGALWITARAAGGADAYEHAAWRVSYAVMAASMLVGTAAVLWDPRPSTRGSADAGPPPGEPAGAGPDANPGAGRNSNADSNADADTYLNADSNAYLNAGSSAHVNADSSADSNADANSPASPAVCPGASPAPVTARRWRTELFAPFVDFVRRYRWHAVLLLGLVSSYRLANIVMGVMANTFYHDIGFTKDQVAAVSKVYGVIMALAGGFVGGALTLRLGIPRMMWGAAFVSSASILFYALLATRGPDISLLMLAVSTDNFAEGVAGTVFIAFLSGLTRRGFSATQYAVLSSIMLFAPKFVAGFSGVIVDAVGYATFFCGCAASGVIPLTLVWAVQRYVPDQRFSNR